MNRVTSGNVTTFTGSMSDFPTESLIMRLVASGNIQTLTFPEGHWQRRVVGNNTITVTHSPALGGRPAQSVVYRHAQRGLRGQLRVYLGNTGAV